MSFMDNVKKSFKKVKKDISRLQQDMILFSQRQEKIVKSLEDLQKKYDSLKESVGETGFVAAKNGRVFYKASSPFAKRIKNKVHFNTRKEAMDQGYKPNKSN